MARRFVQTHGWPSVGLAGPCPLPKPAPPATIAFDPSVPLERSLAMSGLRFFVPMLFAVVAAVAWRPAVVAAGEQVTARARQFLQEHTKKLEPLEVAAARAWWDANISGKEEDFQKKIEAQN